jgi:hypothetical protein
MIEIRSYEDPVECGELSGCGGVLSHPATPGDAVQEAMEGFEEEANRGPNIGSTAAGKAIKAIKIAGMALRFAAWETGDVNQVGVTTPTRERSKPWCGRKHLAMADGHRLLPAS